MPDARSSARRLGRVLAPDVPGFGAAANADPLDLDDMASMVAARIRHDDAGTLIGCSLGSQIAIRATAELGSRLRALVLASPTVDRHHRTWSGQLLCWRLELAVQPPLNRKVQFEDHAAAGRLRVPWLSCEALRDRPEEPRTTPIGDESPTR